MFKSKKNGTRNKTSCSGNGRTAKQKSAAAKRRGKKKK